MSGITLTMPATIVLGTSKLLKALGANLILTEGALGPSRVPLPRLKKCVIPRRKNMCCSNNLIIQPILRSMSKPRTRNLGSEHDGEVDVIVAGVGTSTAISRDLPFLKQIQGKASSPASR